MKVFRKVNGIFAQKMTKNTKFTTNDRTRNTKFILDHAFKWILRENGDFYSKNLKKPGAL